MVYLPGGNGGPGSDADFFGDDSDPDERDVQLMDDGSGGSFDMREPIDSEPELEPFRRTTTVEPEPEPEPDDPIVPDETFETGGQPAPIEDDPFGFPPPERREPEPEPEPEPFYQPTTVEPEPEPFTVPEPEVEPVTAEVEPEPETVEPGPAQVGEPEPGPLEEPATFRTADFQDSDGDGVDDRDQIPTGSTVRSFRKFGSPSSFAPQALVDTVPTSADPRTALRGVGLFAIAAFVLVIAAAVVKARGR